jgi:glycosyltransferase involved in cell wall biosynthesis
MRIELVSEHANPLAAVGGVDAGGQNVHVAALAAGLVRRGHDVVVSTRRDDRRTPQQVHAPDGYVVEHVPAGPPTEVPKDDLLSHMAEMAAHLGRRWSEEPPDIVHAHFWMSGVAATSAAAVIGLPVVQTFHALGTVKRRYQGDRDTSPPGRIATEARLCQSVARVLATCRDEVAELTAMGLDPSRAAVVPCGVDTTLFTPSPPPAGDRPRLLVVGRLVERKGVADVVTALADLPGVDLLVAGGPSAEGLVVDPEAVRLRELAEANGTADRLHLLGSVPRAEMPALLRSADVVVAVPWYEPFGIVPLEAMACGRPVVGSAVGGLLDTVVHGVTGDLVPPRRPDLLAATLRALLADPSRRAAYAQEGVRRVRARYDWERVSADTEAVYAEVLAGVRRRRTTVEVLR